jgi:DNA-binding CsgD family transcriptional regulator
VETTNRLTLREVAVLALIARGCTYEQAAAGLGISAHTVATHIKNIYRKLDVHSAGAAVMRAIELRQIAVAGVQHAYGWEGG